MTSSWHMCNQGDAVGSIWILHFQPMSRRYTMRRCKTNAHQASFCTRPMVEHIWVLMQGRPCMLAETLCMKMTAMGEPHTLQLSLSGGDTKNVHYLAAAIQSRYDSSANSIHKTWVNTICGALIYSVTTNNTYYNHNSMKFVVFF